MTDVVKLVIAEAAARLALGLKVDAETRKELRLFAELVYDLGYRQGGGNRIEIVNGRREVVRQLIYEVVDNTNSYHLVTEQAVNALTWELVNAIEPFL